MYQKINKLLKWKHFNLLFLIILFTIGFLLRAYLIDKNLFFGPEQGRDMLVVKDIVINHKLVLIGPRTAIEGIFHGPLYYYLATIPFVVSKGNPLVIELFFILLNSLSVFAIYLLGKELFNKRTGQIASLLFTFSFGAIVMARWLSHPPLIIPIGLIFLLFLTKFVKGESRYLLPAAIFFGISSQTAFFNLIIYSFILFLTVVMFWKRFVSVKIIHLIVSVFLVTALSAFNFILFDLRHGNLILNSIMRAQTDRPQFLSYLSQTLTGSATQFMYIFSNVIIPVSMLLAVIIFISAFYSLVKLADKYKTEKTLMIIWLLAPFLAFILLRYNPLYHYFVASMAVVIILTAVLLDRIASYKKEVSAIAIGLLIVLNLFALYSYLPNNKNVFFQSTQPDLKYEDQVAVIKEVYRRAEGKPFYFQAYTIPYWMQDGWQYLFWYYGIQYGYVPVHMDRGLLFVIIQNDPSTKRYQTNWLKDTVSGWGIKESEFKYGALRVEKLNLK